MANYINITARPVEGTPAPVILGHIFSAIHLELVKANTNNVGICFPNADVSIGDAIRLHSEAEESLKNFPAVLNRFVDYCNTSSIREVPVTNEWRHIQRVQPRMSASKIRRLLERGSINAEEAANRLSAPSSLRHPYLHLSSHSTDQKFKLFISQSPTDRPGDLQTFSSYGLGGKVPWF